MFASNRNNKFNQLHHNRVAQNKEANKRNQLLKFDRMFKQGNEFDNTNKGIKKEIISSMNVAPIRPIRHIDRITCDFCQINCLKKGNKTNHQRAFYNKTIKEDIVHQKLSCVYLNARSKFNEKTDDSFSSVRRIEKNMNNSNASKSLSIIKMKIPFPGINKAQHKQQPSNIFKGNSSFLNSYSSSRNERKIVLFSNQNNMRVSKREFLPPTNRLEDYDCYRCNKNLVDETSKSPSAYYSSYCHPYSPYLFGKTELSNSMIDLYYLHKQNSSMSFLRSARLNRFILKKKISLGSNNNLNLINSHNNACGMTRNSQKEFDCKCYLTRNTSITLKPQLFNSHRKCSYHASYEDELKQVHYSL